ncbi:serine hydrolase domain-containing protein [Agrococcus versicolor]|uniref:Serine hydrolase domain-containing protein n=1 Tax=Agrococcus versicolor TaxID=501482 RepID=A0ABP5MDV5_9MICO
MSTTTASAHELRDWLASELPRLIEAHGVPAASAAVLVGDEIVDAAAGILHVGTGVEATTDALFQIGSLTKVWTATLVLQLVDDGLLDLDEPIRTHLPDFAIADDAAAATITARHLLSHRAGFEGDVFTDTGRGDDCVERYVASLGDIPQLFAPGTEFSYSNAGFIVLGRLVEVLRGVHFEQALTERIIQPLGLTHAAPGPYEAIVHRVAQGHVPTPDGPVPAPMWALARSNGPAGSSLAMRPADLLAFARMHVAGGVAADGTRLLSEASVAAMQDVQGVIPDIGIMGDAWGLGWDLTETPHGRMVSHDGGTFGQSAFLRVIPSAGVAIALCVNGGDAMGMARALLGPALERLVGADVLKPLPVPQDVDAVVDEATAERFLGTYATSIMETTLSRDEDGRLWADEVPQGILAAMGQPASRLRVVPHGAGLVATEPRAGMHTLYAFTGGEGPAAFLHAGRAMPRRA